MTRDLSPEEMKEVLTLQVLGHLACCEHDQPYIVPMAFAYKGNVLYGQTVEGMKTDILRRNPNCCFHIGDTKGSIWRSVICYGTFEELDFASITSAESKEAVRYLHDRLSTVQDVMGIHVPISTDGQPVPQEENGNKATLFRIVISEMTGRAGKSQ